MHKLRWWWHHWHLWCQVFGHEGMEGQLHLHTRVPFIRDRWYYEHPSGAWMVLIPQENVIDVMNMHNDFQIMGYLRGKGILEH